MDKTYNPNAIETVWYQHWEDKGYFMPQGGGDGGYCIVLPPPNVTGSLHMGHAFQQTLMDVLIRYQRMNGVKTLWQCGTDHAGIATQMVVERQLEAKGTDRHQLGREQFTAAIWDWKNESGNTISRQSRRLGSSMDWSRERFTMDAGLSHAVQEVFIQLYREGLIYRGKRLVNWDPVLLTAISDLEVIAEEEQGYMWHIRYPRVDGKGHVTVATTRPETMLGDVAVAVHPDDERYRELLGKELQLPLTGRTIPVIADDYVDPEFGSGCVKITPAHDFNDNAIGQRHDLPMINIFTDDAKINEQAPEAYRGLDRYDARKQIVSDLQAAELLEKTAEHKMMVPRGDRSQAVIEPYLTDQWYVKVEPLAAPAIAAVENGSIRFVPENWTKTYFDWMHNIQDWCISRQLWWGHRIPAWYDDAGNIYVGEDEAAVRTEHKLATDVTLTQDPDVLDTWFSSALWPFSTLGWPEKTPELTTFYPTSVLVTGFDIIFFWVARMIMLGLRFIGEVPFREVYVTGLIRDAEGQKMSKSKGNILDPIDLIDGIELEALLSKQTSGLMQPQLAPAIEKATRQHFPDGIAAFGTDSLRFTFAQLATQGRDIRFDVGRIQGYRNFCNKLWNASRFVLLQVEAVDLDPNTGETRTGVAERWIISRLAQSLQQLEDGISGYRFDLASQALYEFTWDEYCDWYLELAKTRLNSADTDDAEKRGTLLTLLTALEILLRALHPFMPFITEELWQKIAPLVQLKADTIMLQPWPQATDLTRDDAATAEIEWLKSFILGVRRIRAERDIAPGKLLAIQHKGGSKQEQVWLQANGEAIKSIARLSGIEPVKQEPDDAVTALAGDMTIVIPLADLIDPAMELARLEQTMQKLQAEKQRATSKLENDNFVRKAPEQVIAGEREKQAEAEKKMRHTQARIESIKKLLD
ncbi:MAG: valine--tRNA ligase [Gammaproteobacteria bacterium]